MACFDAMWVASFEVCEVCAGFLCSKEIRRQGQHSYIQDSLDRMWALNTGYMALLIEYRALLNGCGVVSIGYRALLIQYRALLKGLFDRIYGCFDGVCGALMCVQGSMWGRKPTLMTTCDSWLCAHNLVCCLSTQCIVCTYMCTCNVHVHICVHTFVLYATYGYARTTWSVVYLHNVFVLHICEHLMYVYMFTHVYSTRELWLCTHDLVSYLCTHCIDFAYMCTCNKYNQYVHVYTHVIYTRIVAMRAQPGLFFMYTLYCIYIFVYM